MKHRSNFSNVEFESDGDTIRGRLYMPAVAGSHLPAIVMTPGFGATITMAGDKYADTLATAGFAVLLFDHAGFGASGGEPRQQVNPWRQVHEYRCAVDFLADRDEVDAYRIALWGFSYSGSIALIATSTDERVAAVVALVPALGPVLPPDDPDHALFKRARDSILAGPEAWPSGVVVGPMPIVTADPLNAPAIVTPISAFRWSVEYGGRHGTGWQNVATVVRPDESGPLHAGLCTPHLAVPSLWLIAPEDEVPGANPAVSRVAYDVAGGDKELVEIDGGHFGLLTWPGDLLDQSVGLQQEFLRKVLSVQV